MRKKKRAFALLEVLIAIALAGAASFILLDVEGNLVAQNRKQLLSLQRECYLQEATVKLYEALYCNHIPWRTIEDSGSYPLQLSQADWRAECRFTPVVRKTKDTPDHMVATVAISVLHSDKEIAETSFKVLAMREDKLSVETPQK